MRDMGVERILAHGEQARVVGVPGGDVAEVGLVWPLTPFALVGLGVASARVGVRVFVATGSVAGLAVLAVRSAAGRIGLRVLGLAVIPPGPAAIGARVAVRLLRLAMIGVGRGSAHICGLAVVCVRLPVIRTRAAMILVRLAAIARVLNARGWGLGGRVVLPGTTVVRRLRQIDRRPTAGRIDRRHRRRTQQGGAQQERHQGTQM